MPITLTSLTAEVQTRCNALTGSSTITQVIDAAIAAKKVEQAGGVITRTALDTELQRVINLSGGGSYIEDLIALAAATEVLNKTFNVPIGSTMSVGFSAPAITTLQDGSEWLMSGWLMDAVDYPEAAQLDALKVFGGATIFPDNGKTVSSWAYNGTDTYIVRYTDGTGIRSTDNGATFSTMATVANNPTSVSYGGGRFIFVSNNDTSINIRYSTNNGTSTSTGFTYTISGLTSNTVKTIWIGNKFAIAAQGSTTVLLTDNGSANNGNPGVISLSAQFDMFPAAGNTFWLARGGNNLRHYDSSGTIIVTISGVTDVTSVCSSGTDILYIENTSNKLLYSPDGLSTTDEIIPLPYIDLLGLSLHSVKWYAGVFTLSVTRAGNYVPIIFRSTNAYDWELVQIEGLSTATGSTEIINNALMIPFKGAGNIKAWNPTVPSKVGRVIVEGAVGTLNGQVNAWRIL